MNKFVPLFAFCLVAAASAPSAALAADDLRSTVSVYAGGAFMQQYYDDCGNYYEDCGGYYDRSDTYAGPEFGADVRMVLPNGMLFDLSGEHARVSDYGDAFLEQQLTAGVGYAGRLGRRSSWYLEGFYQYYRLGEDFFGCNYSCNGWYRANGGGVKGGFTWPFADRFFGTLNLRISYLSGKDREADLVQAKLDGSVGYMIAENFSVALGASSQAIQQTGDRDEYDYYGYDHADDTLSHTSVFLRLALHF